MKPRKVQRLIGRHVTQVSCNTGTSAAVTREGELFMFGKDTRYCDQATGVYQYIIIGILDMICICIS